MPTAKKTSKSKKSQSTQTNINELAKKLGLKNAELRAAIAELGFEIDNSDTEIDNDLAELVESELADKQTTKDEVDTAELYDEMINEQIEREIVKKQRKKTAGKSAKIEVKSHADQNKEAVKGKVIEIGDIISVKEFSEKIGISAAKIIGELMKNGILANLNQQIDYETASIIATDLGVKIKKVATSGNIEDVMAGNIDKLLAEDDPDDLELRPPVISIMGHVDHGKTKILDYIRNADVVSTEAGGITQHIGAYQVVKNNKKITFLDTPGHEAFTEMRARGARATDIAILVVAADEGVKPQTIEAINHAKEAGIPIIVAINKMDKEGANPDKVKGELVEHGLQPEDWGGDTIMVPVSAISGLGMDDLLDMILLVAEMKNLKANPHRHAVGTVIEAHLDQSLGPVATILINAGEMKIGDNIVVGSTYGKVKTMMNHKGKRLKKIGVSDAVRISGLSAVPHAGDVLQVCKTEKEAKEQAIKVATILKGEAQNRSGMGMDSIISQINQGKLKTLKIVLKADTKGSLEAIKQSLAKIKDDSVAIKIIHSGIGGITEGDVMMAAASRGLVIGFHVQENSHVAGLAEKENVDIMKYKIIYKLIEDMENLLGGLIEPEVVEVEVGRADIRQIFMTKKKQSIIGCKIANGFVHNKLEFTVMRGDEKIGKGIITSLQHNEKKVDEMKEGQECGMKVETNFLLEDGDQLVIIKKETRLRTLGSK